MTPEYTIVAPEHKAGTQVYRMTSWRVRTRVSMGTSEYVRAQCGWRVMMLASREIQDEVW